MKNLNVKKKVSLFLALLLLFGVVFSVAPVFAEENIQALTLEPKDFTIIRPVLGGDKVKVYGLTHDWKRVELSKAQKQKITFEIEKPDIVNVLTEKNTLGYLTKDTFYIYPKKEGMSKVIFKYGDSGVQSVHTVVVGEPWVAKKPAKNITLNVMFNGKNGQQDIINKQLTVAPSQLSVNGKNINDTLLKSPTALHALVKASTIAPTFKLDIDENSGFLKSINGIEGYYDQSAKEWHGWKYKVNTVEPEWSAGIHQIYDNDVVTFVYE